MKTFRLVVLESPYAAPDKAGIKANVEYAEACIRDCLRRGEAPFASHLLYTGALRDELPEERALGMSAGFDWGDKAVATVVYLDRGLSNGMRQGIERALLAGRAVEWRYLNTRAGK